MKLAKALLEQNLTDNALEVLDGCIYLSGNNPVFITEKANALEQLGRHSEAAKLAEESKRLKAAFASAIAD
jgi:hypothetical protein